MEKLYEQLISYTGKDYYPMHMPGHKRNTKLMPMENPYQFDITEIEGFDNLHQMEGVLKHLSERLSSLYGAGTSYPLVNGSTAGILAAISAATKQKDKVLIARNSHKAVYHAAVLRGLKPVYLYPPVLDELSINGGIWPEETEELLIKHKDIKLVIITSPTYEGIVSDVKAIAEVAHRNKAMLLVDEAHGAHFGFHESFPESAVTMGADLVIQSLHKTLPAFTQTAVLHSNCPQLDRRLRQYLSIYQSSSPSYLLMAGIDRCCSLLEEQGKHLFDSYQRKLKEMYQLMKGLKHISILGGEIIGTGGVFDMDRSKIIISGKEIKISGHQLLEQLRNRFHIEMEMAAPDYVLGMTGIGDTQEGLQRMADALITIDHEVHRSLELPVKQTEIRLSLGKKRPVQVITPQEAMDLETERVKLTKSIGRVSGVFVSLFPPGSPLLVPGELISLELVHDLQFMKKEKLSVAGLSGTRMDEIEVINETIHPY